MPIQQIEVVKVAEQIWSHPTWDIILMFALLASGFFYGLSAGKRRISAIILYTYAALAVSSVLPLKNWFGLNSPMDEFVMKSGAFLALLFLLAFFLGSKKGKGFAPASSWWQIFLLSFLQVGFLIHAVLGFLPEDKIKLLAPVTKNFFANPDTRIWWLVLPLASLVLIKRLESKEE